MDIEQRVDVFIKCFVSVRSICTLHELESQLCLQEGVKVKMRVKRIKNPSVFGYTHVTDPSIFETLPEPKPKSYPVPKP